jgi:hypothetical protein
MAQDKLTERYTVPISAHMRDLMLSVLDERAKERLRCRIRYEIARVIHESLFDPGVYLSEDSEAVQSLLGKLLNKNRQDGKPSKNKVDEE